MAYLTGLALAFAGWATLGLGMDRHYADIHKREKELIPSMRRRYRLGGALALIASYMVNTHLEGWAAGSVLYLGTLTAAALPLVLTLTYAPGRALMLGRAATALALVLGLAWLLSTG
ncbi:MAG TPA: DUF3325 domain-containing protein [Burkholderiaceae bacterium]|nr:DUF3325 domain-containing protein [Burkholderiaceae bacterium]